MQKETVLQVLEAMPQDVDLDELLNKLYVLEQIEEGERSLASEPTYSQADVEQKFGI
jgi:hypothetical protein